MYCHVLVPSIICCVHDVPELEERYTNPPVAQAAIIVPVELQATPVQFALFGKFGEGTADHVDEMLRYTEPPKMHVMNTVAVELHATW